MKGNLRLVVVFPDLSVGNLRLKLLTWFLGTCCQRNQWHHSKDRTMSKHCFRSKNILAYIIPHTMVTDLFFQQQNNPAFTRHQRRKLVRATWRNGSPFIIHKNDRIYVMPLAQILTSWFLILIPLFTCDRSQALV